MNWEHPMRSEWWFDWFGHCSNCWCGSGGLSSRGQGAKQASWHSAGKMLGEGSEVGLKLEVQSLEVWVCWKQRSMQEQHGNKNEDKPPPNNQQLPSSPQRKHFVLFLSVRTVWLEPFVLHIVYFFLPPFPAMFCIIYIIPNMTCMVLLFLLSSIVIYVPSFHKVHWKIFIIALWKQSIITYKVKGRQSEHQHPDNPLPMESSGNLSSCTTTPL